MQSKMKSLGWRQWETIVFMILILFAALLLRYYLFPIESHDYRQFLQKWYDTLKDNGGITAIGLKIGDYMPPYFYLLALMTHLPGTDLFWIKMASCIADLVLAFFVMRIVDLRFPGRLHGLLAFAGVLFLPTVFLNSAAWGQCDAMFTSALIACLYYLLTDRPNRAVLAFAISFVLKLQAVFFAPFLVLLFLKHKIKARSFLIIPIVYILSIIPAAIAGRDFGELLTVYVSQSKLYTQLCLGIPNLYTFVADIESDLVSKAAVIFAGGVVLTFLFVLSRKAFTLTKEITITLALFFAVLMPFILPHMHERYYFLADILSVVYTFYFRKRFYTAVILCVTSACSVSNFLFSLEYNPQQLLAVAMLINLILILKHLWELISQSPVKDERGTDITNTSPSETSRHHGDASMTAKV